MIKIITKNTNNLRIACDREELRFLLVSAETRAACVFLIASRSEARVVMSSSLALPRTSLKWVLAWEREPMMAPLLSRSRSASSGDDSPALNGCGELILKCAIFCFRLAVSSDF